MPIDLSTVQIPRLPYPDELVLIATGQASDHHEWPPPGMARLAPFGSISYALTGECTVPGWYWSTAEEINPAITGVENVLAAARWTGLEVSATIRAAVEVLGWVPLIYERGKSMQWLNVGIHAALGSAEQMIHTVSLTPSGVNPAPLPDTDAGVRTVAQEVADAWSTAFGTVFVVPTEAPPATTSLDLSFVVGSHVTYDAVTASVLEQTTPSPKVYVRGQHLVSTVVPTQRVNITPALPGYFRATPSMPYEVAAAVTLLTRSAGSRNRGRLYLGGFCTDVMATGNEGKFTTARALVMGKCVGKFIEEIRANTPWQVSIVSGAGLVSHEVVRTAVGLVPDAQRRRRGSQTENRVEAWVSPTV